MVPHKSASTWILNPTAPSNSVLNPPQTDLCHSDEVGDDGGPLRGSGLAEHHELDPLGDTVEKGDETLQDWVFHCAAVHHKAVVVLKLKEESSITHFISFF